MSWIFVSHSSRDKAATIELSDRLKDQGFEALFLDFDSDHGIGAGRDWERVLYHKLRHCAAALVLCSESSVGSKWCFAEITQARSYDKTLFPLRIDGGQTDGLLGDIQAIDLTGERKEDGYRRLWDGLREAGINPRDSFRWDPARPPYPGLLAFEGADAGVYFGRGPDIRQVYGVLDRMRRGDAERLAVIAGPSGSGKSSLARAGIIPRLEKDPTSWAVRLTTPRDGAIPDQLLHPPPSPGGAGPATVLLFVDQLEELLTGACDSASAKFLDSLRRTLAAPEPRVLALATLRADFLGRFLKSSLGGIPHRVLTLGPMPQDRFPQIIEGPAAWADIDFDDDLVEKMVEDTQTEDALPLLAFTLRELYEDCQERHDRRFTFAAYNKLGGITGAVGDAARDVMAQMALDHAGLRDLRRAFLKLAAVQPDGSFVRRTASWGEIPEGARPVLEKFIKARLITTGEGEQSDTLRVIHDALFRAWPTLSRWLDDDREFQLWRKRIEPDVAAWRRSNDATRGLLRDDKLAEAVKWRTQRQSDLTGDEDDYIRASIDQKQREDKAREEAAAALRRLAKFLGIALGCSVLLAVGLAGSATLAWKYYADANQRRQASDRQARMELARRLATQANTIAQPGTAKGLLLATEAVNATRSHDEPPVGPAVSALMFNLRMNQSQLRQRFDMTLSAAALGPGGRRVAVVGSDGSVQVRDRGQSEPVFIQGGRADSSAVAIKGEVMAAVALSDDGSRLAVGGADGRIRVWAPVGPDSVARTLQGSPKGDLGLTFSAGGRFLAAGGADGKTRVWDLEASDGQPVVVGVDSVHVHAIALSRSGSRLATGSEDGTVRVWDLRAPQPGADRPAPRVFDAHFESVFSLWMSPDGKWLISPENDSGPVLLVRDLDGPDAEPVRLRGHAAPVSSLSVGAGGKQVVAGCNDGRVFIWDLNAPRVMPADFGGPPMPVLAVALRDDGERLSFVRAEGTVWDADLDDTRIFPRFFGGHEGPILSVAVARGGRRLASGSSDGTARIWDTSRAGMPVVLRGDPQSANPAHTGEFAVPAVTMTEDGNRLVSGDWQGVVRLWDLSLARPTPKIIGRFQGPVMAAALTPDGRTLATGGADGVVRIWDLTDPEPALRELTGPGGRVFAVALTPDGRTLAAGGDDGVARVWDLAKPGSSSHRDLVDTAAARRLSVHAVALTPDGRTLIVGANDGVARIWKLDDPSAKPSTRPINSPITSLSVTRSGPQPQFAFGSLLTVGSWGLSDPAAEPLFLGSGTPVSSVAIYPDGSGVVWGSFAGRVGILPLSIDELVGLAERFAGRNFRPDEWREYFPDTPYRKTFPNLP